MNDTPTSSEQSTGPASENPTAGDGTSGPSSVFTRPQLENILTLDRIMSSARRARRVARICLAGDVEGEYLDTLNELGELVTSDGQPVAEDVSMDESARIAELRERAAQLRDAMAADTFSVVFEGMAADEWDTFEATHRNRNGELKDPVAYTNALIVACAVEPKITDTDVAEMRKVLRPTQIEAMANAAYGACATGGVDVPKLPSFWHAPKRQESSLS